MTVFQNKLMNMALIILIAISLLGSTAFVLYQYFLSDSEQTMKDEAPEKLSIDEILERTVETKEIKTNLADDKYILIKFAFQLDSIDAKEELQKRNIQLNSTIISVLASTQSEEIHGEEGLKKLETTLLNRVNEVMEEGKVVRVYITDKILQ
jgi:flagellar FliL protein